MNIFITGIAGFLGSHLADECLKNGHNVYGNDNLIGGYEDNIPKGVNFSNFDCNDYDKLNEILKLNEIDILYHCAATAYEGFSVFSPNFVTKNIFQSSISVFSAALNNNIKRIIFCSSMARYGEINPPFTEDSTPNPVDPYGIAKLAAEKVLINLCNLNNIEWVIAVPHNIVGPRQKYDDPYRNVMSIIIHKMLKNESPVIYGDGEQKRCFSFIDDCISPLYKMMISKEVNKQIINIGPDEGTITINELVNLCANHLCYNGRPTYFEDRPLEVKNAFCSSNKARKLLNYKTTSSIEKAISETANYIKLKGIKNFEYNFEIEINNNLTPKTWKNKII